MRTENQLKPSWAILAAVIALECVVFGWFGIERLVARDEGFYVYAAQLVLEGQQPYRDFFYPQMPLLPYLYAGWLAIFGISWTAARMFSAFLSGLIGIVLYLSLFKLLRREAWALAGVGLYLTSVFALPWYSTAQTYTLSTLLLFTSTMLACLCTAADDRRLYGSGLFFGLAVSSRLFFAGLAPIYILYLYFSSTDRRGIAAASKFIIGAVFGMIPAVVLLCLNSEAFVYNNLGYHLSRSGQTFSEALPHKLKVLEVVLGLRETRKFEGIQLPLSIWLVSIYTVLSIKLHKRRVPMLAILVAGGLFLLNLLPTPTYVQYWCTLVPFLIVGIVGLFADGVPALFRGRTLVLVRALLMALFVLGYGYSLSPDLARFAFSGEGVIGIGKSRDAANWKIENVERIAAKINEFVEPGGYVYSIWPGYLVGSHARALPGTENQFSLSAGKGMSAQKRERLHLISKREVRSKVSEGQPRLIVANPAVLGSRLRQFMAQAGYRVKIFSSEVSFWFPFEQARTN